jgi:catechol 2,3-dioxygenase-like lactoylglutathione lyase family enzyme
VEPEVGGILETALYVEDLDRSERFYRELFGFEPLVRDERLRALNVRDRSVLLLLARGASAADVEIPGGTIPGSDASGEIHRAFAVPEDAVPAWSERLAARGVDVESCVRWPRGGESLYFRDPDGHVLELVTPGCWEIY